jgi:hypothetical protein
MNFKLSRQCPFYDPNTPQWSWCGRPCSCRAFIIDRESRNQAINGGIAVAPNYDFNIMPGDRQPGFKPFPGYGVFNKPQDPVQRAKAEEVAALLPNTGFGLLTHQPKPRPKPDEDEPPKDANTPSNIPAVRPDVRQPFDKKAYQRELMRKRRAAKKSKQS